MLGILDHNLTTVTVPMLEVNEASRAVSTSSTEDRKRARDEFDADIFGGRTEIESDGVPSLAEIAGNSLSVPASSSSMRLVEEKMSDRDKLSKTNAVEQRDEKAQYLVDLGIDGAKPKSSTRFADALSSERLNLQRTSLRSASPAPSSLSAGLIAQEISSSRSSEPSDDAASSGASTPRMTPTRRIKARGSKGSFASRFANNWLFGALGQRSQPSFPTAAAETVGRHDVSITIEGRTASPTGPAIPSSRPQPVPGAPVITPSTPSPAKKEQITQPLPIGSRIARVTSEDQLSRSQSTSVRLSRSPVASSWGRVNAFHRGRSHVALNPCNPKENVDVTFGEGRRWQHVRPRPTKDSRHLVKWASMCTPACLPLTTDFMPTPSEIQDFYEFNSYDIACYPEQVSFLVRTDAAHANLPLAVMREMASQRLSRMSSLRYLADCCRKLPVHRPTTRSRSSG